MSLPMVMIPFQHEEDGCSQEILKVENELALPFVGIYSTLYSIFIILIENCQFSMDFFSYLEA
jgi:hypothetical protein